MRLAERRALELVSASRSRPVTDPLGELSAVAGEIVAVKDALARAVRDLSESPFASDAPSLLTAYERALDRAQRVLVDMARLDIDERWSRISKADGERFYRATREAMEAAALTPEQEGAFSRTLGLALRRLVQQMRDDGDLAP